ncbi:hypothetical protein V6O07_21525, partial [Arthrospira platensis SPKY2]
NSKPDRTSQRIFTVKPRLRQTAVVLRASILLDCQFFLKAPPRQSQTNAISRLCFSKINVFRFNFSFR